MDVDQKQAVGIEKDVFREVGSRKLFEEICTGSRGRRETCQIQPVVVKLMSFSQLWPTYQVFKVGYGHHEGVLAYYSALSSGRTFRIRPPSLSGHVQFTWQNPKLPQEEVNSSRRCPLIRKTCYIQLYDKGAIVPSSSRELISKPGYCTHFTPLKVLQHFCSSQEDLKKTSTSLIKSSIKESDQQWLLSTALSSILILVGLIYNNFRELSTNYQRCRRYFGYATCFRGKARRT